jgi:proline iminopeptidase
MPRRNWMVFVLLLTFVCLYAQEQTRPSLSVPPYHNVPTQEGYFQGAGGVRLFYRVAGREGDPILFLHGGPGLGLNDGGYDMEPLAERSHRLFMFNERGAGRSEIITDPSKLRMQDFAEDVEAFRKEFGLEKFGIIGLSWGSLVAVNYITAHPERVTRVVFLSPMSPTAKLWQERKARLDTLKTEKERKQEREARDKIKTAADADVPPLCEQIYRATLRLYVLDVEHFKKSRTSFCPPPVEGLRNAPFVMKATVENLGDWDLRPLMKNVHVPALLLEGAETKVPLEATREWEKFLPDARLLLIPSAGHQNWVDQPEAVISAMDEFFRGHWPVGSSNK